MKSKSQIPGWSVLVATLFVAIATTATITTLRQQAEKIQRAEILLIQLETQAYQLYSLEDHAISEQELEVEIEEKLQAVRSRSEQTLAQVIQLAPSGQSLQQVKEYYHKYITAADEQLGLIKAGQFAQADTVHEQRVEPSFEVLSKEITDVSATYSDMVHWTNQKADMGSALSLVSATVAIGLLFWKFNSAQRHAQIQILEAEQKVLRQSEQRFRTLVQNALDVIIILGVDSTIRYVSDSLHRILNYHPDDWVGTNILNWVHSNDAQKMENFFTECLRELEVTHSVELQFQHSLGHWCWVEAIGNNQLSEPSVGGIVLNFRDITERLRAEEELKTCVVKLEPSNRSGVAESWDDLRRQRN